MESGYRCDFVLLDLGYPMNTSTINNVIKSLENILALALSCSQTTKEMTFGISILNSNFAIFETESNLRKNYELITKSLNASLKTSTTNSRITIQEYKYFLSKSIEAVMNQFEKFTKNKNFGSQSTNSLQIAVVTKKAASILADILTDVRNKLEANIPNVPSAENLKIVQIINEEEKIINEAQKNKPISWVWCSDDVSKLSSFFKGWLFKHQQQLKIVLSKELELKCNVEDCLLNPITSDGRIYAINNCKSSHGILKLEVINRLTIGSISPMFMYNIRRRVYPIRLPSLQWIDLQVNSKIFNELCQELQKTGEGLLAKSLLPTKVEVTTFHFLTSGIHDNHNFPNSRDWQAKQILRIYGDMLLMSDLASEELYLSPSDQLSKAVDPGDESAASIVRTCLNKIKLLDEYDPKHFLSGMCEYLKDFLADAGRSKSLCGNFDPDVKLFGRKRVKHDKSKRLPARRNSNDDNFDKNPTETRRKGSKTEIENIHPALLSPDVVVKYRKIHSQVFNLPELGNEYNLTGIGPNSGLQPTKQSLQLPIN